MSGLVNERSKDWPIVHFAVNYANSLYAKSISITRFLERQMFGLGAAWLLVTGALAASRLSRPAAPVHGPSDLAVELVAYALIVLAPILGFLVARAAFVGPLATQQPRFRLALVGRWRKLTHGDAHAFPSFGPVGFMASLLIGLLLNVVIRMLEFFTAVPAMGVHAPQWGQTMFAWMALDVIVTGFFYMVTFVMALRSIPLFPRMLFYAWLLDITMQLLIAERLSAIGGVPPMVVEPLLTLLDGNVTKVLISAAIWLPYLILSERVNVTYRHRTDGRLAHA
jgi:hypothetical protein